MPEAYFTYLFAAFAFIFGAVVGSFLNVCIYRMPEGLSVNKPKRSFCPHCKYQIPWFHNLPLLSWVILRAKCANCGAPIPFRYFFVELLTAGLFLAVWLSFPPLLALPYMVLMALFITATFIDLDHFIIPDEITWGGAAAGVLFSLAIPSLMGTDSHLWALFWSLLGAGVGYGTLFVVVELGKKAFGKKRITLEQETAFTWTRRDDDADLRVGDDTLPWSEIFSRETDRLTLETSHFQIDGGDTHGTPQRLAFSYNRAFLPDGSERVLDELGQIEGRVTALVIPREAMGFGDVKFIACIGAFLGWKAVFFTVFAASILGSVVGVTAILAGNRQWSAKIPFGPYLALGATLWMFYGPQLLAWYLGLMQPGL